MYILILVVLTINGATMDHIKFNSNVSCLEAMSKILEFEKHRSFNVIKAQCVKE